MNNLIAIIPSAWNPQNELFPWVYDPMIPINWKPTIDYIIWNITKLWIKKAIVILNKKDSKTFDYLKFRKNNIEIIIRIVNTKNLKESILSVSNIINNSEILIHLWDSIYTGWFNFSNDNILIQKKDVLNPEKWCFIDENNNFINWPSNLSNNLSLIIWLYYIKDSNYLIKLLAKNSFYDSLTKYWNKKDFSFQNISEWYYDLWHIDEFHKSKIDFLRVRSFNSLYYDNFKWIITKKSSNINKLKQEINWFNQIPDDIKIFTPRLINYDDKSYSLEFYWYNSLADIFLYSNYNYSILSNILNKLFEYINYVKNNFKIEEYIEENFYEIYFNKTFDRLNNALKIKDISEIYNKDYLIINWNKYKNISYYINENKLKNIIKKYILNKNDYWIIHWDLCFSNILFDIHNWLFKLIDPRWSFWKDWIWWDIKYDIAKLRHSIHWRYENIISDLFNLEIIDNYQYNFTYFNWNNNLINEYFDKKIIEMWYNIEVIKFIEGLLYLTMIPLHSDSLNRQKVMYLTATILFNETEKIWM